MQLLVIINYKFKNWLKHSKTGFNVFRQTLCTNLSNFIFIQNWGTESTNIWRTSLKWCEWNHELCMHCRLLSQCGAGIFFLKMQNDIYFSFWMLLKIMTKSVLVPEQFFFELRSERGWSKACFQSRTWWGLKYLYTQHFLRYIIDGF